MKTEDDTLYVCDKGLFKWNTDQNIRMLIVGLNHISWIYKAWF